MTTMDLFPELPAPNKTTRSLHGLKQYLVDGTWRFCVSGFDASSSGEAGFCTVIADDDTRRTVPIDAQDRLLIDGHKYGRNHWIH